MGYDPVTVRGGHIIYDRLTSIGRGLTLAKIMARPHVAMRVGTSGTAPALSRRGFLTPPQPRPVEGGDTWLRVHRRAMACRFEITFDAKNARYVPLAQAALNKIDAIESQLTVFRATS